MSLTNVLELPTFGDERGTLSVAERKIPFEIKRVYYIYDAKGLRGGHRHKTTHQALICLNGPCEININNGKRKETILLNKPEKCLILDKEEWHTMGEFSEGSILLVLSSTPFDIEDYIDDEYPEIP